MRLSGKKRKNVIIRDLSDEDRTAIDAIIADTGCRQASKAIMRAVHSFVRASVVIRTKDARIKELETENHILLRNAHVIVEANRRLESLLISKRECEKTER